MAQLIGSRGASEDRYIRRGYKAPGTTLSVEEQRINALEDMLRGAIEDLFGGGGGDYGMPSEDYFRQQATSAIGPQYDAQIAQLRQLMDQATQRTNRDKTEARQLYDALSNAYTSQVPVTQAQTKQQVAATQQNYQDLLNSISGNYQDIQDQQAALFAKLGIEAAAPEISSEQLAEQARLKSLASTQGAAAAQREQSFGNADVAYMQRGAPIAKQEGINTVEDLMNRLNEYLNQQGVAITGLQGQKQGAITDYMNQLASQYQQSRSAAEQDQWQKGLDLIRILQQERDSIYERQRQQNQGPEDPFNRKIDSSIRGQSGVSNFIERSGLSSEQKQRVSQAVSSLILQAAQKGDVPPEIVAHQALSLPVSTMERQVIYNAILVYYGNF